MVYFEEYVITYYLMFIVCVNELIQSKRITQSQSMCECTNAKYIVFNTADGN